MFDTNNLVDNRALLAQMKTLKNNNAVVSSNAFINGLLDAKFLLPAEAAPARKTSRGAKQLPAEPPEDALKNDDAPEDDDVPEDIGCIVIKNDIPMFLPAYTDPAGNHYMMVYTDWDELCKWPGQKQKQETVVYTYPEICKIIAKHPGLYSGFVINPFGRNLVISRKAISKILVRLETAAGIPPRPAVRDDRIYLGDPKIFPLAMAIALKQFLHSRKEAMSAYLMVMMRDARQSYLIVVDCSGDSTELFSLMGDLCEKYLKPGQLVDIIPAASPLGQQAMNGRSPFFAKWIK